ncbi:hypothetical protein V8C86DRAFT_2519195, partial [Haematococcus lacustris]
MIVCSWFPILPLCTLLVCRSALHELHRCSVRLSALAPAKPSERLCDTRGIGSAGLLPMAATVCTSRAAPGTFRFAVNTFRFSD